MCVHDLPGWSALAWRFANTLLDSGRVTAPRKVSLWARNRLYVDASVDADGVLTISGQDLGDNLYGGDYEYFLTVDATDVPTVVAALGGAPGDDVLDLLAANAEQVISAGEKTWLESLGISPGFSSWVGS